MVILCARRKCVCSSHLPLLTLCTMYSHSNNPQSALCMCLLAHLWMHYLNLCVCEPCTRVRGFIVYTTTCHMLQCTHACMALRCIVHHTHTHTRIYSTYTRGLIGGFIVYQPAGYIMIMRLFVCLFVCARVYSILEKMCYVHWYHRRFLYSISKIDLLNWFDMYPYSTSNICNQIMAKTMVFTPVTDYDQHMLVPTEWISVLGLLGTMIPEAGFRVRA